MTTCPPGNYETAEEAQEEVSSPDGAKRQLQMDEPQAAKAVAKPAGKGGVPEYDTGSSSDTNGGSSNFGDDDQSILNDDSDSDFIPEQRARSRKGLGSGLCVRRFGNRRRTL